MSQFWKWSVLCPLLAVACTSKTLHNTAMVENQDPNLWLEEVESPQALQFAKEENKKTLEHFKKNPLFSTLEKDIRKIVLAKDRLPDVRLMNGELYNFWQDEKHVRGLWRKTTIASYKSGHPHWTTILDLDALEKKENENWVWKGSSALPPHYEKALLFLSRGGKDATVVREFNLKTKSFVKDGFTVPEAKSSVAWKDENTLYVGSDFGPGSMTDSGYPRVIKLWKRGTSLAKAPVVFEGQKTDMSAHSFVEFAPEGNYIFHSRQISFYESQIWYEDAQGQRYLIPMPLDADFSGVFKNFLLYRLRSDLDSFKQGSLVALPLNKITEGEKARKSLQLVFAPSQKRFLEWAARTKNHLLLSTMDNILAQIEKVSLDKDGHWHQETLSLGNGGVAAVTSVEDTSDDYLAAYTDFLTPSSIYKSDAAQTAASFELLGKAPERFQSKGMRSWRYEATSRDGTKIPYFVVAKKDLPMNGENPTLLYGYGGFEIPMQPSYMSVIGKAWLERGGVYVLANLRGGGEFGPAWHHAVIKENRYKVFEDFAAVAEDLIARKITSPQHLGIKGGSNGGLLTGASFVARPDLFNAVLCQVPLLDMLRYHKLLAGASWMDEYGNPDDPKMREAILKYSPYQKVKADAKYPEVFFMTSTKDDRVHPGHARKMVAKMRAQGHPVFYYENTEGGHARTANLEQNILWTTLEFTYLWEKLGPQP